MKQIQITVDENLSFSSSHHDQAFTYSDFATGACKVGVFYSVLRDPQVAQDQKTCLGEYTLTNLRIDPVSGDVSSFDLTCHYVEDDIMSSSISEGVNTKKTGIFESIPVEHSPGQYIGAWELTSAIKLAYGKKVFELINNRSNAEVIQIFDESKIEIDATCSYWDTDIGKSQPLDLNAFYFALSRRFMGFNIITIALSSDQQVITIKNTDPKNPAIKRGHVFSNLRELIFYKHTTIILVKDEELKIQYLFNIQLNQQYLAVTSQSARPNVGSDDFWDDSCSEESSEGASMHDDPGNMPFLQSVMQCCESLPTEVSADKRAIEIGRRNFLSSLEQISAQEAVEAAASEDISAGMSYLINQALPNECLACHMGKGRAMFGRFFGDVFAPKTWSQLCEKIYMMLAGDSINLEPSAKIDLMKSFKTEMLKMCTSKSWSFPPVSVSEIDAFIEAQNATLHFKGSNSGMSRR